MPRSTLKRLLPLLLSTGLGVAGSSAADTVDPQDVTVFQPGTTLESTAMNATLQALVDAINDNAARIAALEAGGSSDVAGRAYQLRQMGMLFRGNGLGAATVANLTQTYTLLFDGDGSFDFSGEENEGEVNTGTGSVITQSLAEPVVISGTWTQQGSSVTLTIEGEQVEFVVSLDGRVMLLAEFGVEAEDDVSFTRSESSFVVGIEVAQ